MESYSWYIVVQNIIRCQDSRFSFAVKHCNSVVLATNSTRQKVDPGRKRSILNTSTNTQWSGCMNWNVHRGMLVWRSKLTPQICDPFKSWALWSVPWSRMKLYKVWSVTHATPKVVAGNCGNSPFSPALPWNEGWRKLMHGDEHVSLDKLPTVAGVFCWCISWPMH